MDGCSCDFRGCRTRDFLPFVCDLCKRTFCTEHRSRFAHACTSAPATRYSGQQAPSGARTSDIFHAVESRFQNTPEGSKRTHFGVKTSAIPTDANTSVVSAKMSKLDNIANTAHTSRDKNIAGKTKQILFKNKAKGNDNIAYEDRFYVEIRFDITGESRYLFFSCHATVGEVLRDIAKLNTTLAYGRPAIPDGLSLAFFSEGLRIWQDWDRSATLSQVVSPFTSLHVITVSTESAVKAQEQLSTSRAESKGQDSVDAVTASASMIPSAASPLQAKRFTKGDRIVHTSSNGTRSVGEVVAVHRDDTELYYTVQLQCCDIVRERQTDAGHLELANPEPIEAKCGEGTASTDETFSVKVSYKGKSQLIRGVPTTGMVDSLKAAIAAQIGVPQARQKLIYRGKVLRNNTAKLRGTEVNIPDKAVIMLMMNE